MECNSLYTSNNKLVSTEFIREMVKEEIIAVSDILKGDSAYEVAKNNGYKGTEEEWLMESGVTIDSINVTTGLEGSSALGTLSGTPKNRRINLTIPKGDRGVQGVPGVRGETGLSAYDIAIANGFKGTKIDWLSTIKGDKGIQGPVGPEGKSTYNLAVAYGFKGTEREWLTGLVNDTQLIANLYADFNSIQEAANGSDVTDVVTRTGVTYPTIKKTIKNLMKQGTIDAEVFKTKALMETSLLLEDAYALVTDDSNVSNNGYYQKRGGIWVYLRWNPVNTVSDNLNKTDAVSAQSGLSIYNYLEDIQLDPNKPVEELYSAPFNKYTGKDDPTLLVGYVDELGRLITHNSYRSAEFIIPDTIKVIKSFSITVPTYFAVININGGLELAGNTSSSYNVQLTPNSHKLIISASFPGNIGSQDFNKDFITFSNPNRIRAGNHVLRHNDVAFKNEKPKLTSSEFLFTSLPSFSTAVPITPNSNAKIPEIFSGIVTSNGSVVTFNGGLTAKIPIPDNAKSYDVNLSSYLFVSVVDNNLSVLKVSTSAERNVRLPSNAKFLLVGIKQIAYVTDVSKDKVIFYYENSEYVLNDTLGKKLFKEAEVENVGKVMIARNQYIINGFDCRLYTESLFSGYAPLYNYSIEVTGTGVVRDRGKFSKILGAGVGKVSVYNHRRILIDEKSFSVYKKDMPSQINATFSVSNPLQVLFIGDSLIWNNDNLIGKEWLRMLNTQQSTQTVVNGVVYPPTFNLGKGNIKLVGTRGTEDRKYELGNTVKSMMQAGPFYNSSSNQIDSINTDGWNNRVDLVNYFQTICGVGKYPRYIYLASGVNDIVELGWDINSLPLVRNMMKALLGKIKEACDIIAGGNSNVQILLMNHQFYPLNEGTYEYYSNARQRLVWAIHYEEYEKMINEQSVNDKRLNTYVRFVDCASSFDIDHGYSYETATINPRSNQTMKLVVDPVHMGEAGACMYADALLRDFLYHECV